uniref:LRRNT domain-containing protein n=1 Tax=Hippocampus comes TaxID=109280 RepID=A0A3Q2YGA3_HIPCM
SINLNCEHFFLKNVFIPYSVSILPYELGQNTFITDYFLAGICVVLLCLRGFASPGVCPDRCDCQQPQRLTCANRGLRFVPPQSGDREEVLVLSLGGNFIGNISAVDLGSFTGLVRLDLQFNQIQSIHPRAFEKLYHLEELYLGHNHLSEIHTGTLQPLKKLTVLYGNNNDIIEITPGLFDTLDRLVKLRLDGNKIQSLQDSLFKDLDNLRYLHLESNQLQHIHRNAFSKLANLRFLNLSRNKLPALRGAPTFSLRRNFKGLVFHSVGSPAGPMGSGKLAQVLLGWVAMCLAPIQVAYCQTANGNGPLQASRFTSTSDQREAQRVRRRGPETLRG